MSVLWISPLFSLPKDLKQLCVEKGAEADLVKMGAELAGTQNLAAIYVPMSAGEEYRPGGQKGRVAGLVKLLPMPDGKSIRDFTESDIVTGQLRWPFGWPIETVVVPAAEQCPTLRNVLISAYKRDRLAEYSPYLMRPHRLEAEIRREIEAAFKKL